MIPQTQVAAATRLGLSEHSYRMARRFGDHAEVLEAYRQGISMYRYCHDRSSGMKHSNVIRQFNRENPLRVIAKKDPPNE